ncbi:MAG: hydrogenase maturation protease [candidate division Zixibacteria bacterium]|nr:hydrogenase maturation protease [candidate division Zixibacteria bacterium]
MNDRRAKPLVLGLGNDLLGDDGIGILAARELTRELDGAADVAETGLHGVALLDLLIGYDRAVIIDAINTGRCPAGTILELGPEDFKPVSGPSPHYTGLPELISLAKQLHLEFPGDIKVFAVESSETQTVGAPMSAPVAAALSEVVERVKTCLGLWLEKSPAR